MTDVIEHNLKLNKRTGMGLIDVKKAFDWYGGLIFKMLECKFPKYPVYFVRSFLINR